MNIPLLNNTYTRLADGMLAEVELLHWQIYASFPCYKDKQFRQSVKMLLDRSKKWVTEYENTNDRDLSEKVHQLLSVGLKIEDTKYLARSKQSEMDDVWDWLTRVYKSIKRIEELLGKTEHQYEWLNHEPVL